jgi:hypothetical protein
MSDVGSAVPGLLSALRALPLSVSIGLALAAYAILFVPGFAGIDPGPVRQEWGVWIWIVAVAFSVLSIVRVLAIAIDALNGHRRTLAARKILRFVPLQDQRMWHLAKQQDESFIPKLLFIARSPIQQTVRCDSLT